MEAGETVDMMDVAQTATQALESAKSAHHRIDELTNEVKDIKDLTNAMVRMDEKVDGLEKDVKDIKNDIKGITTRPGKLWDKLIAAIIGAVGAGIASAILALILK